MASLSSEVPLAATNSWIGAMFDLDEALDLTTYFPINDDNAEEEASHESKLIKSDPKKPFLVSTLPVVAAGSEGAAGGCSVCIESFGPAGNVHEEGRQLPCGHVFHAACIDTWLSMFDSCPLCRCKVSSS